MNQLDAICKIHKRLGRNASKLARALLRIELLRFQGLPHILLTFYLVYLNRLTQQLQNGVQTYWGGRNASEAQLQYLEIYQHMNIENLMC